jgi:hypothetical protein
VSTKRNQFGFTSTSRPLAGRNTDKPLKFTFSIFSFSNSVCYPYEGDPTDVIEEAERQVFDVLALNLNEYLPDFDRADTLSKKGYVSAAKASSGREPQGRSAYSH